MNMPLTEALAYLIILMNEAEEAAEMEHMKFYMDHLSRMHAQPAQSKDEARANHQFLEDINPDNRNKAKKASKPLALDWDFETMEKLANDL